MIDKAQHLNQRDVLKLMDKFTNQTNLPLSKQTHQISFNCYEAITHWGPHTLGGYGKTPTQAYCNTLRKLIELIANSNTHRDHLADCLKRIDHIDSTIKDSTSKHMDNTSKHIDNSIRPQMNRFVPPPQVNKAQRLQESFLNLQNVHIYNPNTSLKTCPHEKYMNQGPNELKKLKETMKELQIRIQEALIQQTTLKNLVQESSILKSIDANYPKKERIKMKTSIDDKTRSISVQNGKILNVRVPKLNLEKLPNYHGKSNKSLNQSLLEAYEKIRK